MTLAKPLVRRALFLILAGTVVFGASACQPRRSLTTTATYTPSSGTDQVLSLLNGYRSANGLAALALADDATAKAQQHTNDMAAQGTLFHSSDLAAGIQPGWSMLGENVAVGSTPDEIQAMFEGSGPHRDNMLNGAYDQVGIGVAHGADGRLYVTQFFVAR